MVGFFGCSQIKRIDAIASGAAICHYDQKKKHNDNQMWALTSEGFIYVQSQASLVLSVKERDGKSYIHLADKSSTENKAQRWNFVLPVFKKKQGKKILKIYTPHHTLAL